MADGADAANARHQGWHLVERTAFAKLFEAAELRDVKASLLDGSIFVEMQSDFGMTLDSGHGVDNNCPALLHSFTHDLQRITY